MNTDIVGTALIACHFEGDQTPLTVNTSYGDPEEMGMDFFFRDEYNIPDFEWVMADLAKGKTIDVGAGCGSHSLLLQSKEIDVVALEISAGAATVARERGVKKVHVGDFKDYNLLGVDTITMVMNGIGLVGTLEGFEKTLDKFDSMLNKNGQILFDTTDISYLYEGKLPKDKYYGEVSFQFEYKGQKGDWFPWLYLDMEICKQFAEKKGWQTHIAYHDEDGHYVVRLQKR